MPTAAGASANRHACMQIAWVPGSFELPVVAKGMAKSGKYASVVCIGAVVSVPHCRHACMATCMQRASAVFSILHC